MVMISPVKATMKPAPAETFSLAHRDAETARSAELRLVVGEAVLGLRHANRHMGETERLKLLQSPFLQQA